MSCECLYAETCPSSLDKAPVLYRKWNQILSQQQGGAHAPASLDWRHNSLVKILKLLNAQNGNSCGN